MLSCEIKGERERAISEIQVVAKQPEHTLVVGETNLVKKLHAERETRLII